MGYDFDLFVIGGGSGGVRAARVTAALRDKRVGLAEMDRYGGTCVIRGCVPKKLMVFASDFPSAFKEATAYGWELPKANRIDWGFFSKKLNAEVSRLEGIYRNLLKNSGVQTFDQHAKVVDAHTIELGSGTQITSEYILLATGGKPDLPDIPGIDNVIISKTGYTGSGGFELYVSNDNVEHIWDELFSVEDFEVKPIGLAARDTLRLEMGYCLYGNDINESVTPIEANLGWITKLDTNFIGSKSIKEQIENGIKKKLVGFVINDKGIPRKGYEIFDKSENLIGEVTSGTFSPVLKKGIGLAYIENNISSKEIYLKIRNNLIKLEVVKTPFI